MPTKRAWRSEKGDVQVLSSERLLVSGVATTESIAAAVVERAIREGAEVLVAADPREVPAAEEARSGLVPAPPAVVVDATNEGELIMWESELRRRWGRLDSAPHAIPSAPRAALGSVMDVPAADVEVAVRMSVWTDAAFGRLVSRLAPPSGGSLVGLVFDDARAWPVYTWMGPCRAALRALNGYLARGLGAVGGRASLVAAGPRRPGAVLGIPDFGVLVDRWDHQARLAWVPADPSAVADAICVPLPDLARAITGEVLHVDSGVYAMATRLRDSPIEALETA